MLQNEYQGQNITQERADNLLRLTAHVPVGDLEAAALEHIKTQDFFPRVAQLLRTVEAVQETAVIDNRVSLSDDRWHGDRDDLEEVAGTVRVEGGAVYYGRWRSTVLLNDEERFELDVANGRMRPLEEIESEIRGYIHENIQRGDTQ